MTFRYEQISASRFAAGGLQKYFPYGRNYKPEESNRIINNLVIRIDQYLENAGIDSESEYETVMTTNGERITNVNMKSRDVSIVGNINYSRITTRPYLNGKITAVFDFKSNKKSDKQVYLGLAEIINNLSSI